MDYFYERIRDEDELKGWVGLSSHALHGSLMSRPLSKISRGKTQGMVERWHAYKRVHFSTSGKPCSLCQSLPNSKLDSIDKTGRELVVVSLKIGNSLNGHAGIVHGGVISLLFDEAMGYGYDVLRSNDTSQIGFTAMLKVNYRQPTPQSSPFLIRVYSSSNEGRKVYLDAEMTNPDGSILYADARALFLSAVNPKSKL